MTIEADQFPGRLLGRPDLGLEVILEALAEAIRHKGGDPSVAAGILDMAERGNPRAMQILNRVVLPPPCAPLSMPIQTILAEKPEGKPFRPLSAIGRLLRPARTDAVPAA